MKVNDWLEKFKTSWTTKDLDSVISLFSDDVVYFETPFVQLASKEVIFKEWQGISDTENIEIDFQVFVEAENKSAVNWELSYNYKGEKRSLKGTYLIELNEEGLCKYFQQTCEAE